MYAVISNADWLENNKHLREPYSPSVPIEVAWRQINYAVVYANAGSTPYSSNQVTDTAYQLVFNMGIFVADCRELNQRASDNKALPHLKVFPRPFTRSGTSCCKTIPALPTAPRTMSPHTQMTGTYNKRRWIPSLTWQQPRPVITPPLPNSRSWWKGSRKSSSP